VPTWTFETLDVFTDRPLAGNQLAVFPDARVIPESLLQRLAQEIGFSETVFAFPDAPDADARIRIFTPTSEVPFAGHPVLGTAILLARRLERDRVLLATGRGQIPIAIDRAACPATRGTMRQPIPSIGADPEPARLLAALGVASSLLPVTIYDNGIPHVYVTLDSPARVAALEPDFGALARLARDTDTAILGINVCAGAGLNWKTRMFAPADGIVEDAATGSAAGPLALHLARHRLVSWGAEIRIEQGAEIGRPSELFARVSGDADSVQRIEVGGCAVPVGGGWFDADALNTA
jgi:trans-2,3-dihydro-3-hydroxyanthranilate isomerase